MNKDSKEQFTDKIDAVLTHPIFGVPIFFCIMALVFFLTFTIGDALAELLSSALDIFSGRVEVLLAALEVSPWLQSLIIDGII